MNTMTPNTVARTSTESADFDALVREARFQRAMRIAEGIADAVRALATFLRTHAARRRTLDELARLDDRTLADIGLSRSMIVAIADGAIAGEPSANENRPLKAA
jgi:uncharacterized protein YjiS (DUF1127 family)